MSTTTMSPRATVSARPESSESGEAGFFAKLWHAIVAVQERRARTYLRSYLAELPSERLKEMGYGPHEIQEIKSEDYPLSSRWI